MTVFLLLGVPVKGIVSEVHVKFLQPTSRGSGEGEICTVNKPPVNLCVRVYVCACLSACWLLVNACRQVACVCPLLKRESTVSYFSTFKFYDHINTAFMKALSPQFDLLKRESK